MALRGRPHLLTDQQVKLIRSEYSNDEKASIEYLSHKYDVSTGYIYNLVRNKTRIDPDYSPPLRKPGGEKKRLHLPDHIKEIKNDRVPKPTTLHRARGQNLTINRFK